MPDLPAATQTLMPNPLLKSVLPSALTLRSRHWQAMSLLAALLLAILAAIPGARAGETRRCLSGEEQRAAIAGGKTMPLAAVIHALHRQPKDVIKAQLCQEPERLVYMLTLLGRDGKVKRAIVDAANGAVVGER